MTLLKYKFLTGMSEYTQGNRKIFLRPSIDTNKEKIFFLNSKEKPKDFVAITSSTLTCVYKGSLIDHRKKYVPVYLKFFLGKGLKEKIKSLFFSHRAIRSALADQLLIDHGFSSPTLLALGFDKTLLLKSNYFIVTEELQGYCDLYNMIETFPRQNKKSQHFLIKQTAKTIAVLHSKNFSHGDLRPGNIMVNISSLANIDIAFIDNERTIKHRQLPEKLRIKNLVQLNMLISPYLTKKHRLLFFITYCRFSKIYHPQLLLLKVMDKTRSRLLRLVKRGRLNSEDVFL